MSLRQKIPLARLGAEGLVIIAGVLVALAIDRWAMAIDDRALEESYLSRLIDNLAADSLQIALKIQQAEDRGRLASGVLSGRVTSRDADPEALLRRLETIAWYAPADYSRDAWDELVSSGNLLLLRDTAVRRTLSAYYDRIEWLGRLEANWNVDMLDYFSRQKDVLPPLIRLQVLGTLADEGEPSLIGPAHVDAALKALREDADRAAELGTLAVIYGVQSNQYGEMMADVIAVLDLLRGLDDG